MRLVFLFLVIFGMILYTRAGDPRLAKDVQHAKHTVLVSICPPSVSSPFCHVMTILLYDS